MRKQFRDEKVEIRDCNYSIILSIIHALIKPLSHSIIETLSLGRVQQIEAEKERIRILIKCNIFEGFYKMVYWQIVDLADGRQYHRSNHHIAIKIG